MLSRTLAQLLHKESIHVEGVVTYLKEHNLTSLLPLVLKHLYTLKRKDDERNTLIIESPFPVGDKGVQAIRRMVGNDMAEVREIENTSLLAGFLARYKSKEYDASAKTIIRQFIQEQ
ncbi:MAG: F0F1 ATP synthase subunit delta [Candidatus Pacebacteria bacterium]|jgi:F0F1-type ATP synthase delta subunit|nr:F0F1 ATP synthase subunit delta [Candidatus Paceibacterota bacterium]